MLQSRLLGRLVLIWTARVIALTVVALLLRSPINAAALTSLKRSGRGTRVESQCSRNQSLRPICAMIS
jgi:hypothetical protein